MGNVIGFGPDEIKHLRSFKNVSNPNKVLLARYRKVKNKVLIYGYSEEIPEACITRTTLLLELIEKKAMPKSFADKEIFISYHYDTKRASESCTLASELLEFVKADSETYTVSDVWENYDRICKTKFIN